MNKEELESFEELNINLQDIDDLDIGLEIISYKVRKSLQELADVIINQSCQISTYKDKEDKLREYCKTETFEDIYTYIDDNIYVNPKPIFNDILKILNDKEEK